MLGLRIGARLQWTYHIMEIGPTWNYSACCRLCFCFILFRADVSASGVSWVLWRPGDQVSHAGPRQTSTMSGILWWHCDRLLLSAEKDQDTPGLCYSLLTVISRHLDVEWPGGICVIAGGNLYYAPPLLPPRKKQNLTDTIWSGIMLWYAQ